MFEPAKKNPGKLHIIIFDEIDAIGRARGTGNQYEDVVLNQLLTMLDGGNSPQNVLVIGMTNRKDILDEAHLRPGRLAVHIHIGLPDAKGREEIFRIHGKTLVENKHLNPELFPILPERSPNYSGAEIESLIKAVKSIVLRRYVDINNIKKSMEDLVVGDDMLRLCREQLGYLWACVHRYPLVLLRSDPALPDLNAELPKDIIFTMNDFEEALKQVQPRFGSLTIDNKPLYDNNIEIYNLVKNAYDRDEPTIGIIHGASKKGKTIIARDVLNNVSNDYKYYLGGRQVLGNTDEKINLLRKIFSTEVQRAFIVIDNIEILLSMSINYYDVEVLQTLLLLLNERSHNILIVCKNIDKLQQLGVIDPQIVEKYPIE